jgi:hypothetical protein
LRLSIIAKHSYYFLSFVICYSNGDLGYKKITTMKYFLILLVDGQLIIFYEIDIYWSSFTFLKFGINLLFICFFDIIWTTFFVSCIWLPYCFPWCFVQIYDSLWLVKVMCLHNYYMHILCYSWFCWSNIYDKLQILNRLICAWNYISYLGANIYVDFSYIF